MMETFLKGSYIPQKKFTKEYLVKTYQDPTEESLKILKKGCFVEKKFVKPIKVAKVRRGVVKVVIKEGRKHEVRRFFEKAKLSIISLTRIRIGSLHLGKLPPGTSKTMSDQMIESIFN